jgi:2-polyprenyl-3-methyl-5-hydroxy-6-metoxy-1,4-benzoquinol methylase
MKNYLIKKMEKAFDDNEVYLRKLLDFEYKNNPNATFLDVGCGSCQMTHKLFKNFKITSNVYGIDIFPEDIQKKFTLSKVDLEKDRFPFDEKFDVVISNQVIEHLLNKDHLIKESYRVLKQGGKLIISTENISSFDNILSLLLGQEPISQHTGSEFHTNSILSPHFMKKYESEEGNKYLHKNVCSYYGLKRLMQIHGFKIREIKTFGNFIPFFEWVFPIYNKVLIVVGEK